MCVNICKHIHLHTHVPWLHIYVSFCLCISSNQLPSSKPRLFYLLTHWITDCLSIYLDYPCTSVLFLEFVSEPADGRASIYLLLRGWQVDVFRQAFALSSAHCSVLEGLKVVWLVSICRCNHGRFASFRKAFGLLLYPLVFLSRHLSEGTWQR